MRTKKILSLGYVILISLFFLHFIGILFISDYCDFYMNKHQHTLRLILLFCTPIYGLVFSFLVKVDKNQKYIYTALIPFVSIVLGLMLESNIREERLNKYKLLISKAYVEDILIGNPSKLATVNIKGLEHNYKVVVDIKKYNWRNLKKGDSLLVLYAEECPILHRVYELYPTKKQFEQFEKDPNYDRFWNK